MSSQATVPKIGVKHFASGLKSCLNCRFAKLGGTLLVLCLRIQEVSSENSTSGIVKQIGQSQSLNIRSIGFTVLQPGALLCQILRNASRNVPTKENIFRDECLIYFDQF